MSQDTVYFLLLDGGGVISYESVAALVRADGVTTIVTTDGEPRISSNRPMTIARRSETAWRGQIIRRRDES